MYPYNEYYHNVGVIYSHLHQMFFKIFRPSLACHLPIQCSFSFRGYAVPA